MLVCRHEVKINRGKRLRSSVSRSLELQRLVPAAGITRRKKSAHGESIIGRIHESLCSLVSESTVSLPLPSDSSLNSRRARQSLHTEQARIWDVREQLAMASEPSRECGPGRSRLPSIGLGDRRCTSKRVLQIDQGRASPETTPSDCYRSAAHRR